MIIALNTDFSDIHFRNNVGTISKEVNDSTFKIRIRKKYKVLQHLEMKDIKKNNTYPHTHK